MMIYKKKRRGALSLSPLAATRAPRSKEVLNGSACACAPVKRRKKKSIVAPLGYLTLASRPPEAKGGCGLLVPPSSPLNTNSTRLVGGVLKTGESVRVGVGEELGVARHGVARPHGRRAAEDGAPGHRLPFLGEDLLYLGVVPLPPKAHSPQTLDSTRARARELLRKKTLPVGHATPAHNDT